MAHTPLIRELRRCLGAENVLSAPSELVGLRLRRSDDRAAARRRRWSFPARRSRWHRRVGRLPPARCAGDRPGRRDGPGRRLHALSRRRRLLLARMNRILGVAPPRPDGGRRAGSGQPPAFPRPGRPPATISPRSLQPRRGHHRRQRGHERRRPAHAPLRRDRSTRRSAWKSCSADGEVLQLGPAPDPASLDLAGVLCGSEGTLGDRHENLGPPDAESAGLAHPAGDVQHAWTTPSTP